MLISWKILLLLSFCNPVIAKKMKAQVNSIVAVDKKAPFGISNAYDASLHTSSLIPGRRLFSVQEDALQRCVSQEVFKLAYGANSCELNCCSTTWYDTEYEYLGETIEIDQADLTCCFDECGPGLHKQLVTAQYVDPYFNDLAVTSCFIEGCGIYDCQVYGNKCEDACGCEGPCELQFAVCEEYFAGVNDYLRDVLLAAAALDPDCYDFECECINWYKIGHCTAARDGAAASCRNLMDLVNWFCPLLEMCGGDADISTSYTYLADGRDKWCSEAGITPTEDCQLLNAAAPGETQAPPPSSTIVPSTGYNLYALAVARVISMVIVMPLM